MSDKKWMFNEAYLVPFRSASLIEKNKPLRGNLHSVFSYKLSKFIFLCNRSDGIHVFINNKLDEIDFLNKAANDYVNKKYTGFSKWLNDNNLLNSIGTTGEHEVKTLDENRLKHLLDMLGVNSSASLQNALILPFDYGAMNLGKFILWGTGNTKRQGAVPDHVLLGWVTSWYANLSSLLKREYRMDRDTYLPSYYTVGWKRAAILFADIRNFTTMTEILRNASSSVNNKDDSPGPLKEIINDYCSEMVKIIQENNRGRVDKLLGDGIMAIFGEYDAEQSQAVAKCVYVACQMVKKFNTLKDSWQTKAFGEDYKYEYNESVEIDLGVGLDFGTVLFGYLGDDVHRDYSVVGDHVNFAQRLESQAARYDEINSEKRPPILISRTAYNCVKPFLNKVVEVHLALKGKGYTYNVYGIDPADFNEAFFKQSETTNLWPKS